MPLIGLILFTSFATVLLTIAAAVVTEEGNVVLVGIIIILLEIAVGIGMAISPPTKRTETEILQQDNIQICSDVIKDESADEYTFTYRMEENDDYLVSVTTPNVEFLTTGAGFSGEGKVETAKVTTLESWGPIRGWASKKETIKKYTIFR